MFINYASFALAIYFYFRHNWYCEPGSILFIKYALHGTFICWLINDI